MLFGAGPLTSHLASLATAIGAGVLVGGFAAGVAGLVVGSDEKGDGRAVRTGGYWGGLSALLLLAVDLLLD